jgi:hypothetical protein
MSRTDETNPPDPKFDFSAYPEDACFHDRRTGPRRQDSTAGPPKPLKERRARKERRRRIDPTTFEKQHTDEELEFMGAMQRFKVLSGKTFPSYSDVLDIAYSLGYRRPDPVLPRPGLDAD